MVHFLVAHAADANARDAVSARQSSD